MSERSVDFLIEDMWESIEKIERYTEGLTEEEFEQDDKTTDAVVRNLEIIGEAANRLPRGFRANHPKIEWKKIVGLRNRIVHEYFGVDLGIIWRIIHGDLPEFKEALSAIRSAMNP